MSCGIDPTTLRALRDQADLTQVQLAADAGLSLGTIYRLEAAETAHPRVATVLGLVGAFGMDPGELRAALCCGHDSDQQPEQRVAPRMSYADAGRKGGLATRDLYGHEHLAAGGRKGGAKGGATTRDRYGREFFVRIGRIGGRGKGRAKAVGS